jgi:phage FluMu gp28-like protein
MKAPWPAGKTAAFKNLLAKEQSDAEDAEREYECE